MRTIEALGAVADRYGASCAQLALAWLLAQGDDIVPVPATRRPLHLVENYAAQWLPLDAAAESMIRRSVPAIAARAPGSRADAGVITDSSGALGWDRRPHRDSTCRPEG
ncbi:aldo/keto reductase [Paractinoplanes rhizophilus]|uniref:Aldo/keto reductase n=1 Tax=Paractinoplanes rhizophilus TaxID=1416877 RepID=A0ABW2HRU6_9ACTN|nr:aldo/keto reductase [Actinoplanes sp.]